MADITQELEQIRNAKYGDDMRTAIADALEIIIKNSNDTQNELSSLKKTAASTNEVEILKNYIGDITRSMSSQTTAAPQLRSTKAAPIVRATNYSDDWATQLDVTQLRATMNEELKLKASQYDFDYIVGNGFQDWTITDYIIRIREDYNTALAEMATRTEAQAIADRGVERLHKVIAVNEEPTEDTKLSFIPSEYEEIELATMDDIKDSIGPLDSYFTFDWKGEWEIGGLDEHGWNDDEETKMLRTIDLLGSRDFEAKLNSLYSIQIVRYDKNRMMIKKGEWITGSNDMVYHDDPETMYIRLLIKKNDDTDLTDPMIPSEILTVTMHGTDWTGKNDNVAVDISVVNAVKADLSSVDNRTGRLEGRMRTAEENAAAMDGDIEANKDDIATLKAMTNRKFDRVEYGDDNIVYFYAGEELIDTFGPIVSGSGSGGGGGGEGGGTGPKNNAEFEAKNASGSNLFYIPVGVSCPLSVEWSSIEEGNPTGMGTLTVFVNGVQRIVRSVNQGVVNFDPSKWFKAGQNLISITMADVYNNKWYGNITAYYLAYSVRLNLDSNQVYEGAFDLSFTPIGEGPKTVHFKLDGKELSTFETELSNRVFTKAIPAQSHGAHTIEVWVTAEANGNEIESDHVSREFVAIESGITTPIIVSNFDTTSVPQYTTVNIVYKCYDPLNANARVTRSINGVTDRTVTVDRTEQSWDYRALEAGNFTLSLECRGVRKTFPILVDASEAKIGAATEGLLLYLGSSGRDNGEDNPATWEYEDVSATMSGFDFVSNGWVNDGRGNTVLRHSGTARTVVPFNIFESDARSTGLTIEVEFETRSVRNYDSPIISCFSDNRGLQITSQRAILKSEQAEVSAQFKEEEHVRISYTVDPRSGNKDADRLIRTYINGVASGVVQYPDSDDFSQINPVGISIGSDDAVVDVYCIRVYNRNLSDDEVLGNMIADTQDVDEMLALYEHNDIFDGNGDIVAGKLPSDLPYMIINYEGTHMPQFKGDKVVVSGSYTDPRDNSKSFTFSGCQLDVQGTSSQYYARKNYKAKFKKGFIINGVESKTYAMTEDSIPVNTFCFKKDVASSEGANNVILVKLYDEICPYKTPAQELNPLVRQGIEGHPMVIFADDGEKVRFVGKYNFNNDKSTEEVFGFEEGDESWEVKNNTSDLVLYRSNDFSGSAWLTDYEARYPDTDPPYADPTQLAEFTNFVYSTNPDTATNASITPVTYKEKNETGQLIDVTYNTDSAAYRLAKFKNEIGNYVEIDSMLFFYLFTDIFLMIDNRAKNMFPSFIGEAVN